MDNDQTSQDIQQQPQPTESPEWFQQTGASEPQQPKHKLWLIIGGAAVLVAIAGLAITLFLLTRSSPVVSCFSSSNYNGLLSIANTYATNEVQSGDIQSQQLLFGEALYFIGGSTDFDTERTTSNPSNLLSALGQYQKNHFLSAPIFVQLEATYAATADRTLAESRIAAVKKLLVAAGFDEASIISKEPILQPVSEESAMDDDVIDGFPVILSVAPAAAACTGEVSQ